jgi:Phage integrase family
MTPHRIIVRGTVPVPELFVSARGESLTRAGFEYILRKHVRTAKQHCPSLATKRVYPHVLRHTCALTVLQATKDLRKAALWLGHAKTQTTGDVHASGPVGETGSPGIGRASETALRAIQGYRQADRIAKGGHFYAEQKVFKMTYWWGLSQADFA